MTIYEKQRIHEICESIKDDILARSLEESGNMSEQEFILTKKIINENIRAIERMLVEEGYFDYGKAVIEKAFTESSKALIPGGQRVEIKQNNTKYNNKTDPNYQKMEDLAKKIFAAQLVGAGALGYGAYEALKPEPTLMDQVKDAVNDYVVEPTANAVDNISNMM